jgi:DnaK suppressor protein
MERSEQERFRPIIENRMEQLKRALQDSQADAAAVEPDKSIGRLSRLDAMQMQQMTLNARNRQRAELYELEEALQRINRGHFGKCQLCRREIQPERLEYQPNAILCVSCAG